MLLPSLSEQNTSLELFECEESEIRPWDEEFLEFSLHINCPLG